MLNIRRDEGLEQSLRYIRSKDRISAATDQDTKELSNEFFRRLKQKFTNEGSKNFDIKLVGSHLENFKVEGAEELLCFIKIKLPIYPKPSKTYAEGGHLKYVDLTTGEKHLFAEDGYVNGIAMHQELKTYFDILPFTYICPTNGTKYRLVRRDISSLYVYTVQAHQYDSSGYNMREITIDYVPAVVFPAHDWPSSLTGHPVETFWYALPSKEPTSELAPYRFMVCTQYLTNQCIVDSLRLLKHIRDEYNCLGISASILQCVAAAVIDGHSESWKTFTIGQMFLEMLFQLMKTDCQYSSRVWYLDKHICGRLNVYGSVRHDETGVKLVRCMNKLAADDTTDYYLLERLFNIRLSSNANDSV